MTLAKSEIESKIENLSQHSGATLLSIIIPTFNERDNIFKIAAAVISALQDIEFEIVFVDDDSSDGTQMELVKLCRADSRVRMVRRIGRRGLSTAVVEGVLSTSSPYVCVIDADLQHDERIIPQMLSLVRDGAADLVVGSRYMQGGGVGVWSSSRVKISGFATHLASLITKTELTDPMSGFFLITREAFEGAVRELSGQGYKILLDLCASSKTPLRIREVPYEFRTRTAGESKFDSLVVWEYLLLLADKSVGHIIPARFISFAFVGGLGVFIHMSILGFLLKAGFGSFYVAQAAATLTAMVFNFFVNNTLTYRDQRLKGIRQIALGLLTFVAACSIGAFANVGIANYLFSDRRYVWWLAGLGGIMIGVVWNYAVTSVFTWKAKK